MFITSPQYTVPNNVSYVQLKYVNHQKLLSIFGFVWHSEDVLKN